MTFGAAAERYEKAIVQQATWEQAQIGLHYGVFKVLSVDPRQ
jgi:hypothetical protein